LLTPTTFLVSVLFSFSEEHQVVFLTYVLKACF